ncbi:hypothetical protein BGX23_004061 [Mortierella sp. AD031]|nr:hypothetical protein BGX23_004061 [Mortierella sp. AD031]
MPRKYGTTVYVRSKWPLMLRVKGTVILSIWWQIILVGLYSASVFFIHKYSAWRMNYSLSLVTVLGMVVSLLLVFRTNTAYDRYWEGRRLWSQMTLSIRNLTRGIWVCVSETETRDVLEKKSAINLLVAFAFATKHYLREEYGYEYDDMVDLLTHIPKYSLPTSTQPMDWRTDLPTPLGTLQAQPNQQQGQGQSSHMSEKAAKASNVSATGGHVEQHRRRQASKRRALAFDFLTPTNIPVELSYYIGSYIKACSAKQKVDPATLTMMNNALLVANMNELMIPAVMLAAFTLLGILGIGYEIENPFNDDYNDLPLDDFCKVIQAEVDSMVMNRAPVPADWIFSDNNYPLANSRLSAKELSELSLDEVHRLMEADGRPTVHYSRNEAGNVHEEAIQNLNVQGTASSAEVPTVVVDVPPTVPVNNSPPK